MSSIAQIKVFVGMDVHKKSYSLCCIVDGMPAKRIRMPSLSNDVIGFLNKHFEGCDIHTAYEAGFSGFELQRALAAAGFNSSVIHAGAVEVSTRDRRVKTDRRDAYKIATQLASGRLKGIRIPTREEEQRRELTRTRQQLIKHRSSLKNEIRAKLHIFALINPADDRELSLAMVDEIVTQMIIVELKQVVGILKAVWVSINDQLKLLHAAIRKQAKTDPCEAIYRQLPGFGPIASRVCSNELGDLQHFSSCKKLYSFTGMTPGEESSGDSVNRNSMTKQGSPRLRHILVQAAWMAIRKDQGLRLDYERIAKNSNKLKAIVAIARKLIGRARALFRDHAVYKPSIYCPATTVPVVAA